VLKNAGVRLEFLRASGNHDPRIALWLRGVVQRVRPDVVHTWLPLMDIVGGLVALSNRSPWVMAERSSSLAYQSRFKDRVIRRWIGQWADAVAANSEAGQAIWTATLRNARAHVIRNALALDQIADASPATSEDLGVPPGTPVILFVGRLSYEKNIPFLLSIAREVCSRSNAIFLICGDGPLRGETEDAIQLAGAHERIRLLGQREMVWSLMKASQALVSTSSFEGQPNAVLEAMACRCPLVVSDIPAHREFLRDDSAAIVPMVQQEFVSAILRTLRRLPDIDAQVQRAELQVQRYDAHTAALGYEMIYKEAARRHNRCAA
jgi:glycosyltransferase involved in cell wall biosynthesis